MMTTDYSSRKFVIASATLAIASVALFLGHLSGGEWVASITAVLGLYGLANVVEKRQ